MRTTVTGPKTTQPVHEIDTEVKPTATPAPTQRTESDPNADAKAQGSRQHAGEKKSENDMRSQMLKSQLAGEVSDPFRNLGQQFAKSGKTDPRSAAIAVQNTWRNLNISSHAPIAYETAKNLTDQDLQTLAKTKEGREFLQTIEEGMKDGNIEPAHQAQIDRIRKAHLAEALPSKELSNALYKQATAKGPVDGPWLAKELTQEITKDVKNGARTANDVLDKALPADRPRIAAALTKSLSSEQLQELAKTPEGRRLIDRMSGENIPYQELKKLALVPDGEKDPLKRSNRTMQMAERLAWAANSPKEKDDAIAMLVRAKQQLKADGQHPSVFGGRLNNLGFQHLLGPFGLRHMEGSGGVMNAQLNNFDEAVRNWEKMKPAEREAARKNLPYYPPTKEEIEAKKNDNTQTTKKLPDGKIYSGPLSGLKDAEQAANERIAMAKYQFARAGGPFQLLPTRRRAPVGGGGGNVVTIHRPAKYTPKSEAKSGQPSNVGTAPTQPPQSPPVPQPSNTIPGHKPPISGNAPYVQPGRTPTIKGNVPATPPPARPGVQPPISNAPGGQRTGGTSNPPVPERGVPGRGKTLPGSMNKPGGPIDPRRTKAPEKPLPDGFPKTSGTPLTPDQVRQANDARRVGWSMTSDEHARQWKAANPKSNEPPPIAFTTRDGRVQVDEARWVKSGQPALWGNRAGDRVSNPPPPPDKNH